MRKGVAAANDIAIRFNVSNAFVSRDKNIYSVIRFFKPNILGWFVHSWQDHSIAGAIDGTCHFHSLGNNQIGLNLLLIWFFTGL